MHGSEAGAGSAVIAISAAAGVGSGHTLWKGIFWQRIRSVLLINREDD
jgi:hypothetical protein